MNKFEASHILRATPDEVARSAQKHGLDEDELDDIDLVVIGKDIKEGRDLARDYTTEEAERAHRVIDRRGHGKAGFDPISASESRMEEKRGVYTRHVGHVRNVRNVGCCTMGEHDKESD